MLSYKQYVIEKRKNPELNPKISTYEVLQKYIKKNQDVYISFRSINKLGINPRSAYKTPNGIYSYRLESYKGKVGNKPSGRIFPFLGENNRKEDERYLYVFKPVKNKTYGIIRLGNLIDGHVIDFIEDALIRLNYVKIHWIENVNEIKNMESDLGLLEKFIKDVKNEKVGIEELAMLTMSASYNDKKFKSKFFLKELEAAYFEIKDVINLQFGGKEKVKDKLTQILIREINNLRGELEIRKGSLPDYNDNRDLAEWIYENKIKGKSKIKSAGGELWYFTYLMFKDNPNKWNKFFRDMGVVGVDDNLGQGIIHRAEPYQTVFFDKTDLEVVEVALDKYYNIVADKIPDEGLYIGEIDGKGIVVSNWKGDSSNYKEPWVTWNDAQKWIDENCNEVKLGGFSDWVVPTKYELNLIYKNKSKFTGKDKFTAGYYWSSSEDSTTNAWRQAFYAGSQNPSAKTYGGRVRGVRRITL